MKILTLEASIYTSQMHISDVDTKCMYVLHIVRIRRGVQNIVLEIKQYQRARRENGHRQDTQTGTEILCYLHRTFFLIK